jgi:hypothetical protein
MRLSKILALLIVLLGFNIYSAFSQDEVASNKQSEKENRDLDAVKEKFRGKLYEFACYAEAADTSAEARRVYDLFVAQDKELRIDSAGRLRMYAVLKSDYNSYSVAILVQSLDGAIEVLKKNPASIICRIHPKKLRTLALSSSIVNIDTVIPE